MAASCAVYHLSCIFLILPFIHLECGCNWKRLLVCRYNLWLSDATSSHFHGEYCRGQWSESRAKCNSRAPRKVLQHYREHHVHGGGWGGSLKSLELLSQNISVHIVFLDMNPKLILRLCASETQFKFLEAKEKALSTTTWSIVTDLGDALRLVTLHSW